jgi:DNA polymerase III epsilon subunit-like protein
MKFIALDFETGGLDPQRHGVVSLGLAIFENGEVVDSREWIVAPPTNKAGKITVEYDVNALAINGVSWAQIKNGVSEAETLRQAIQFADLHGVRDSLIVSHNTAFDAAFLSQMVFRCGSWNYGKYEAFPEPLRGPWACTRRMATTLGLPDMKLDTVCAQYGLSRTGEHHGALEDAVLCGQVYNRLAEPSRELVHGDRRP